MRVILAGDYPRSETRIGGGVEAVVATLAASLSRLADVDVSVVTLSGSATGIERARRGSVDVVRVPGSRLPGPLYAMRNQARLAAVMRAEAPSLVHAHIAGEYALAAARSGRPWVLTPHGIRTLEAEERGTWSDRLYRRFLIRLEERRAVRRARHVIAISRFVLDQLGLPMDAEVYEIPNPVASRFFDVPPGGEPGRLLFAGRLIPRKGLDVLLRAVARVRGERPDVRLRIAGGLGSWREPASYPSSLRRQVAELDLHGAVDFLGSLDTSSLLEELRLCQAVVLSSRLETSPMAILEAMAAGRAVVSTDCGGISEMVEDGRTGFLVPVDDPDAFAAAVLRLLRAEGGPGEMGRRGRELASSICHEDVVAEKTRHVYERVSCAR